MYSLFNGTGKLRVLCVLQDMQADVEELLDPVDELLVILSGGEG